MKKTPWGCREVCVMSPANQKVSKRLLARIGTCEKESSIDDGNTEREE